MNTFNVTVVQKTRNHPFFGQGSPFGFAINGSEGMKLSLIRGQTYTFNVNAPGHGFYFTTSDTGGQGAPGSLLASNQQPVDQGQLVFTVRPDLPNNFFYQCDIHPKMGGPVEIGNRVGNFLIAYSRW